MLITLSLFITYFKLILSLFVAKKEVTSEISKLLLLQETELSREFAKVNVTHFSGTVTLISFKIEFVVIAINSYL